MAGGAAGSGKVLPLGSGTECMLPWTMQRTTFYFRKKEHACCTSSQRFRYPLAKGNLITFCQLGSMSLATLHPLRASMSMQISRQLKAVDKAFQAGAHTCLHACKGRRGAVVKRARGVAMSS